MDADIDLEAAGSDSDSDATSTDGFDLDAAYDGSHLGGADPGPSTSAVVANLDAGDDTLRDGDLLNRLFGCRSKKTSKLRVTGLCAGNSPGTGEFPTQMASNAENVSIWWRHHDYATTDKVNYTRWTPVFILDMLSLPSDAPNAFRNGQFGVRQTNGPFNGIPSDISAEHNIKAMKGPGGVKNVTRKLSSLIRWGLTWYLTGE